MYLKCTYYALRIALNYGTQLSFVLFLQILIMLLRPDIADREHRVKPIPAEDILNTYDYIIIGAGAAGSVMANRLSENPKDRVLLIEAGGEESIISEVPRLYAILQNTNEDWQFQSESSPKYCQSYNNFRCIAGVGKALGGSSSIHSMMWVRGNPWDFNHWRDLGNPGWGYEDVLPYFKKSENMTIPNLRNSPYHGSNGYQTIEEAYHESDLGQYFLDAGREINYPILEDVNGATQVGFTTGQFTLRNGLRCSAAKAFLRPASSRRNLHVVTYSLVEKILVDKRTKRAYGVQFRQDNALRIVHARKEVILSAGAILSPHVLMLSGIGPKKHLEEVGIEVIQDSPGVGWNLQDHYGVLGLTFTYERRSASLEKADNDPLPEGSSITTLSAIEDFLNNGNGSLYDITDLTAVAFLASKYAPDPNVPDYQLVFGTPGLNAGGGFFVKQQLGLRDEVWESMFGNIGNDTWTILIHLLNPQSKGHIKLRNSDPNSPPDIDFNYFEDPRDMKTLLEAIKMIYKIGETSSMQMVKSRPNPNLLPACAHHVASSMDDYFDCYARHNTFSGLHYACTVKMGPANDTMAVVDSRLKLYGVKGLRVVDASVMPKIVAGNPIAAITMIAEKAADMIKEDHDGL